MQSRENPPRELAGVRTCFQAVPNDEETAAVAKEVTESADEDEAQQPTPTWRSLKGIIAAVGAAMLVACLISMVFYAMLPRAIDRSGNGEDVGPTSARKLLESPPVIEAAVDQRMRIGKDAGVLEDSDRPKVEVDMAEGFRKAQHQLDERPDVARRLEAIKISPLQHKAVVNQLRNVADPRLQAVGAHVATAVQESFKAGEGQEATKRRIVTTLRPYAKDLRQLYDEVVPKELRGVSGEGHLWDEILSPQHVKLMNAMANGWKIQLDMDRGRRLQWPNAKPRGQEATQYRQTSQPQALQQQAPQHQTPQQQAPQDQTPQRQTPQHQTPQQQAPQQQAPQHQAPQQPWPSQQQASRYQTQQQQQYAAYPPQQYSAYPPVTTTKFNIMAAADTCLNTVQSVAMAMSMFVKMSDNSVGLNSFQLNLLNSANYAVEFANCELDAFRSVLGPSGFAGQSTGAGTSQRNPYSQSYAYSSPHQQRGFSSGYRQRGNSASSSSSGFGAMSAIMSAMECPTQLGNVGVRALGQVLSELGVDASPMFPFTEGVSIFDGKDGAETATPKTVTSPPPFSAQFDDEDV